MRSHSLGAFYTTGMSFGNQMYIVGGGVDRRIRVASRKDQVEAPVKRPSRVAKETGAAKTKGLLADM